MLNVSYSPSLWEVSSGAFAWPETTKPWVVATVLVNPGETHAHLQTMCTDSGIDLASSLSADDYHLVSIQCYVIDRGRWGQRSVAEVLVGMLGEAAVAVFRDDHGVSFCPDAPDVPIDQVAELVSAGTVWRQLAAVRPSGAASHGRKLHEAIARERGQKQGEPLAAPAATDA